MQIDQETFRKFLPDLVACWRANRQWNLSQRKLPGLVRDHHRARLLILQAAYMLLHRAEIETLPGVSELSDGGATLLHRLMNWVDALTAEQLYDVANGRSDNRLLVCFVGLYVDHQDMDDELARRLAPKRFAVELVRTQWDECDPTQDQVKQVERLFGHKTKQFAPGLPDRFLKDLANEPADLMQAKWERVLELWKAQLKTSQRARSAEPKHAFTWFDSPVPLDSEERAFFDGPLTTSWHGSIGNVLADVDVMLEADGIPRTLRMKNEATVEKIERRNTHAVREDAPKNPGDAEEEIIELSGVNTKQARTKKSVQAMREHDQARDQSARVEAIFDLAEEYGPHVEQFLDLLNDGLSPSKASRQSGLDPETQASFLAAARRLI